MLRVSSQSQRKGNHASLCPRERQRQRCRTEPPRASLAVCRRVVELVCTSSHELPGPEHTSLAIWGPNRAPPSGAEVVRVASGDPSHGSERSPEGLQGRHGRWGRPGPQGGCPSPQWLKEPQVCAVGDMPMVGTGSGPPGLTREEQSAEDCGRLPGPGPQAWLSRSQDVLAVGSASHEAQVRGSQETAFQQIYLG